eukprot:2961369-Lingulodinium_polyedra.AAC.1
MSATCLRSLWRLLPSVRERLHICGHGAVRDHLWHEPQDDRLLPIHPVLHDHVGADVRRLDGGAQRVHLVEDVRGHLGGHGLLAPLLRARALCDVLLLALPLVLDGLDCVGNRFLTPVVRGPGHGHQ